jgi:hypothetical protein
VARLDASVGPDNYDIVEDLGFDLSDIEIDGDDLDDDEFEDDDDLDDVFEESDAGEAIAKKAAEKL